MVSIVRDDSWADLSGAAMRPMTVAAALIAACTTTTVSPPRPIPTLPDTGIGYQGQMWGATKKATQLAMKSRAEGRAVSDADGFGQLESVAGRDVQVFYRFSSDELYAVRVYFSPTDAYEPGALVAYDIDEALRTKYGTPTSSEVDGNWRRSFWTGDKTEIERDVLNNLAPVVTYRSRALASKAAVQATKDRAAEKERNAKDL